MTEIPAESTDMCSICLEKFLRKVGVQERFRTRTEMIDFIKTVALVKKVGEHRCHDCGCQEGELHKRGCDVERCPKCGSQLIGCEHGDETFPDAERHPFMIHGIFCGRCGTRFPEFFNVTDEVWKHYIPPDIRKEVICWECFCIIKTLTDKRSGRPPKHCQVEWPFRDPKNLFHEMFYGPASMDR